MGNKRLHILIADDDHQLRARFRSLLEDAGFAVLEAASGKQALDVLEAQPVDLLILDLDMPGVDGFDVLKLLRKQRPGLAVLAVSGTHFPTALDMARHLGATATLDKAIAPDLLVDAVSALLNRTSDARVN